jgi:hypothetical protein
LEFRVAVKKFEYNVYSFALGRDLENVQLGTTAD